MHTQCSKFYTSEQISLIQQGSIPKHIAIIMDGNRRWGQMELGNKIAGHPVGAEALLKIVEAARDLGVKTLSLYAFSTENWDRSPLEIDMIMNLIETYLIKKQEQMIAKGIRLETIGNLKKLPLSLQNTIASVKESTKTSTAINMILALNYGGRDEITRAFRLIAKKVEKAEILPEQITEQTISFYLDTAPWGDPEILIRPGNERRISNYLLWQLSYSELFFVDTYWPGFTPCNLYQTIIEYQKRECRRGT